MRTQFGGFGVTELQFLTIATNLTPLFYPEIVTLKVYGYTIMELTVAVMFFV